MKKLTSLKNLLVPSIIALVFSVQSSYAMTNISCNTACSAYAAKQCGKRGASTASATSFDDDKNQATCEYTCNGKNSQQRSGLIPCTIITS